MFSIFSSILLLADTGEIRFLQMFDHETQNFYELVVAVRDQDGLESTASVEINVRDISDVEPRFTQTLYIFPVLENQPNGMKHFAEVFLFLSCHK